MTLTPKQEEVLKLAVRGYSHKQIASKLGRALITIDKHLERMREENECSSTSQLCYEYGKENGN